MFHDIAHRPRAQGAFGIERFIVHGNHQDRQPFMQFFKLFNQVNAAGSRQGNIHQHQVWLQIRDDAQSLGGIGRLAAYLQCRVFINHLLQALAKKRMIIHDQNAAFFFGLFTHANSLFSPSRHWRRGHRGRVPPKPRGKPAETGM